LRHERVSREHKHIRHGTLSLLAGTNLLTGVVHASVEDRHRLPKKLDDAYPPATAIKLILDNHSAHVSQETKAA